MERRTFLGTVTGASLGLLWDLRFRELAWAQNAAHVAAGAEAIRDLSSRSFRKRSFRAPLWEGTTILMVHGFPRTSLMWRFLAPKLAENHTVICVDLRAYGRSGIPASTDDHFPYSKRAMAKELVEVMDKLGFPTFTLIGHDRGGRVSYRLALDHPRSVERLAVFDVIPILEAWSRSDARFAQTYWPWILLSQKEPLPENYLLGAPEAVFHNPFGQGSFGPEILEEYVATYRIGRAFMESARNIEPPQRSMSNTIVRTRKHRSGSNARCCIYGRKVVRSTRFYAKDGGPLGIWRQWALRAQGQAMKGGHFFPEENPDDTVVLIKQFLSA